MEIAQNKKKIIVVASIVVVSIACVIVWIVSRIPDKAKVQESENLVKEAIDLVDDYEFAVAMDKYNKAMEEYDGNVDIYTGIAEIYLLKNRTNDAIESLEIGVKKAHKPSKAYQLLGEIYIGEGDFELAISYLRTAIKQDKTNYEAIYSLSLAYVNDYDFDDARDVLDIPEDAGFSYVKAQILKAVLSGDDIDEARLLISQIDISDIDDDHNHIVDIIELYDDVLDQINELDDEESTDKFIDVLLAKGALDAGYEDIVIKLLEDYVSEDDEYWELNLYLGQAYYINGDNDSAIDCLVNAQSLNPTDYRAQWILGRVYRDQGDTSKMMDSYESAIGSVSLENRIEIRTEYAQILLSLGQYVLAEDQYKELVIEDEESKYQYILLLVESMINRERFDNAQNTLDDLEITMFSDYLLMRYYWLQSRIDFEEGNTADAHEWIEEALEIDNKVAELYLILGQLYFEEGQDEEARQALDKAIDLDIDGNVSATADIILDRL